MNSSDLDSEAFAEKALSENKMQAEIQKLNAEREKIELETNEIRKRMETKWYRKDIMGRIIAVLVSAGIFILWLFQFARPYVEEKIRLAGIEGETAKINADNMRAKNIRDSLSNVEIRENMQAQIISDSLGYEEFKKNLLQTINSYKTANAKSESLIVSMKTTIDLLMADTSIKADTIDKLVKGNSFLNNMLVAYQTNKSKVDTLEDQISKSSYSSKWHYDYDPIFGKKNLYDEPPQ